MPNLWRTLHLQKNVPAAHAARKHHRTEAKKADYHKIFLVEQLAQTEKTAVRREDHEEARKLGDKLEQAYKQLGYEPIRIPAGTVEERLEMILEEVE